MKLQALSGDPQTLNDLERRVNAESRTYSRYAGVNEVGAPFRPESLEPTFLLPEFRVPGDRITLFEDSPSPALRGRYVGNEGCWLPVHPEIVGDSGIAHLGEVTSYERREVLHVSPTASTRTVYVARQGDCPAHFLKLHCPRQISRFYRPLRYFTAEFCVEVSRDLRGLRSERFAYLPESLALAVGGRADGWGVIVRNAEARPEVASGRAYLPFFALYGKDVRHKRDPPLIVQLIDAHGADPADFGFEEIVAPLVTTWCLAARERGILFGAHAENVLLEIDGASMPRRVVHRDLNVDIDPVIRDRKGIETPFRHNRIGMELINPRAAVYSLDYDSFMGHHLLDYLARTLQRHYAVAPAELHARVRALFHHEFPEAEECFPETIYYYDDRVGRGDQVRLHDTGKRPTWR